MLSTLHLDELLLIKIDKYSFIDDHKVMIFLGWTIKIEAEYLSVKNIKESKGRWLKSD
jgi:hypothetical protein